MSSPFSNTVYVWQALFLREALDRFFGSRAAWAWLLVEPAMHIGFIGGVWGMMRRNSMGGINIQLWIIVGMLAFFLFRRTAVQTLHALDCNKAFFAFRQVRPFDVALVRASVEAFSMFFISLFILGAAAMMGLDVLPDDSLKVLLALSGLWLFGLGYGLVTSVCMRMVPDSGHIFQILMMPLYLISGTIMPLRYIPLPYRDWLLWNPLAHGLELVRLGFFSNYHTLTVSFSYLYYWALGSIALGLALYRGLETRLVTQ
ncbi:ABC transporter permease [Desulfovibrio sp.]|uniref:ABC transporter permease n=1 Tax=Desulfovibrio sp. TaxID=885 RepID=UPI0025B9FB92|nr:ABC transporter permease [Desulfovibrio sp.]